jgi:cytochrome c oxidase cbb3-type subunit III
MERTLGKFCAAVCVFAGLVGAGVIVHAQGGQRQTPAPAAPAGGQGRGRAAVPPPAQGGGYADAYPQRPPADPAVVARGKTLYSVNCAFCHGPDARGGDGGGPNLLRSQLVLSDQSGELIGEVVRNGRPAATPPMPPLQLTAQQIGDIATFIHSFRVGGYDITRQPPASIVVGDASAGESAFKTRCSSCHLVTGDLKAVAARYPDARDLQQAWLMPEVNPGRGGRATAASTSRAPSATVTLPSGEKAQGRLIRIDDFIVTIELSDGTPRSFTRHGDVPKVDLVDPLKPHRDLLRQYTDKEIHDITAYLVTVK